MRKLNCLIAVLEVATARVKKSMDGSPTDVDRLARICANLQSTLEVCQRARAALEKRQAAGDSPPEKALTVRPSAPPAPPPPRRPPQRTTTGRTPAPPRKLPPKSASKRRRAKWGKGVRSPGTDMTSEVERRKFASLPPIDRRAIASCDLDDLSRRLTS